MSQIEINVSTEINTDQPSYYNEYLYLDPLMYTPTPTQYTCFIALIDIDSKEGTKDLQFKSSQTIFLSWFVNIVFLLYNFIIQGKYVFVPLSI